MVNHETDVTTIRMVQELKRGPRIWSHSGRKEYHKSSENQGLLRAREFFPLNPTLPPENLSEPSPNPEDDPPPIFPASGSIYPLA